MTSKAERKRRTRARNRNISLPGGETVKGKVGQGARTDDVGMGQDVTATVIDARARLLAPLGKAAPILARTDLAGCAVGRALLLDDLAADYRADLWGAVKHMRKVWAAYDRAIGAPPRHAQCLRILAPSEVLTASASDPAFDDRPEAERARAAVSAYMRLQGWLDHVDRAARSACIVAVVDDKGISNWAGIKRALACVADGVNGRTVLYRGER